MIKTKQQLGKIGLVLLGGFFRGAFQVGALKAFHEKGLIPSYVVGVSVGAINGAAFVAGNVDLLVKTYEAIAENPWKYVYKFNFILLLRAFFWSKSILINTPLKTIVHPTGSSLTCLACHDGALGKDMHGINVDQPRVGAEANVPWDGTVGQRGAPPLSRVDHPISVLYPRKSNGRFVSENPTVTLSRYWALPDRHGNGLTLPTAGASSYLDLPEGKVSSPEMLSGLVRTTSGMVQCDSCHNPHSEKIRPFLRVPSATLCLVCHNR